MYYGPMHFLEGLSTIQVTFYVLGISRNRLAKIRPVHINAWMGREERGKAIQVKTFVTGNWAQGDK